MAKIKTLKPLVSTMKPRLGYAKGNERERSQYRDRTQAWRSWYKTSRWQKLRWSILVRDLFTCQMCGVILREGRSEKGATGLRPAVCDHLIPHKGDEALFFADSNLWAVCDSCHDGACQSIERLHYRSPDLIRRKKIEHRIVGLDGYPTAPKDRWVDINLHI